MSNMNDDGEDWVKDFEEHPENWESDKEAMAAVTAYNKKKDARVNIRVPVDILERLKLKAKKKGLPYQTYIYSELFQIAFSEDVEEKLEELVKRVETLEEKKKNKAG